MTNDRLDRIEQRKRMQPGYVALEIAERDALAYVDEWRDRVGIESPADLLARFAAIEQQAEDS